MAGDSDPIWYLQKHDDHAVFGPVNLDNLRDWAMAAKISPLDRVSCDQEKTWERAPMIAALHMDWLVEVTEDFLYGPTTIGTVQEFLANGEIDESTRVINCKDDTRCRIRDNPVFRNAPRKAQVNLRRDDLTTPRSARGHLSAIDTQKRILELEALVFQQKRTIEELQRQNRALRAR